MKMAAHRDPEEIGVEILYFTENFTKYGCVKLRKSQEILCIGGIFQVPSEQTV